MQDWQQSWQAGWEARERGKKEKLSVAGSGSIGGSSVKGPGVGGFKSTTKLALGHSSTAKHASLAARTELSSLVHREASLLSPDPGLPAHDVNPLVDQEVAPHHQVRPLWCH